MIQQLILIKQGNPEIIEGTFSELFDKFRPTLFEGREHNREIKIRIRDINELIEQLNLCYHELDVNTLYKTTIRWMNKPEPVNTVKRGFNYINSKREVIQNEYNLLKKITELNEDESLIIREKGYLESRRLARHLRYLIKDRGLNIILLTKAIKNDNGKYIETEIYKRGSVN